MRRDRARGEAPVILSIADEPTDVIGLKVCSCSQDTLLILERWGAGKRIPGEGAGTLLMTDDGTAWRVRIAGAGSASHRPDLAVIPLPGSA